MKILVDPDVVPSTLDECLENINKYLDKDDINQLLSFDKNPFLKEKIGAAVFLKSAWSLTDVESLLVRWFKEVYGIDNGDDISALILHCLYRETKGDPREAEKMAEKLRSKYKKKKKVEPE